jgi:hypothetical protein
MKRGARGEESGAREANAMLWRTFRPVLLGLILVALAAGTSLAGKVKVEKIKNIKDYTIETIAMLDVSYTIDDEYIENMVVYTTQALFESEKYHFITIDTFELDCKRLEVLEDRETLLELWAKRGELDEDLVKKVLEVTGYDAIIVGDITHWEQMKLQPSQEGSSTTTVGLNLMLYAADGKRIWAGKYQERFESPPYYPSFNTRSDPSGINRTTSQAAIPEPPRYEKVAPKVAEKVVKKLPVLHEKDEDN